MNLKKSLFLVVALLAIALVVVVFDRAGADSSLQVLVENGEVTESKPLVSEIRDISQEITHYEITGEDAAKAGLTLTSREFPNGDRMLYIEAESDNYYEPIHLTLPFSGEVEAEYTADTAVSDLYTYRKPRSLEDPLSTTLHYVGNKDNSAVIGTAVYFTDISHTYENGEVSRAMELQREAESAVQGEDGLELVIQFQAGEQQFSTWLMLSEEKLFADEKEFVGAHKIGADEFRWITPDTLWSHGLNSIFPKSETAFVRSLVRQSGRASAVMLETDPSRFWENINRHHFASLESARNEDGLWHTDYTSTWLESKYGIGPDYVDSRHNDNIFRSQLKRAELLGYESYAEERAVYADFLIDMANAGFFIPQGEGYYLIDYYDMDNKTHVSLNHVLSLMNYQYDAYRYLGDDKYLVSAEQQFQALQATGDGWIDENDTIIYQMNLDGTMSGNDYNLVTYYDLLYTKKLRAELDLTPSDLIDKLIHTKQQNLLKKGIPIEGNLENAEDFVGLIE